MDLNEAKTIIEMADNGEFTSDEIDAATPHDDYWEPIGEDYYLSPDDGYYLAGPSGGNPTRTMVLLDCGGGSWGRDPNCQCLECQQMQAESE